MAGCCLLMAMTGCEALQRKFTRKPKAQPRPSPITQFQDYTKAMTPLDRYRKHYVLFDYWNSELLAELDQLTAGSAPVGSVAMNPKRAQLASGEALKELEVVQELLDAEWAARLEPLLAERREIDQQLQRGTYGASQLNVMWRTLQAHARQIDREFFWRDAQEHVVPATPTTADAPAD